MWLIPSAPAPPSQAEHEQARSRNAELVTMQEEMTRRQEAIRRATEEKIQARPPSPPTRPPAHTHTHTHMYTDTQAERRMTEERKAALERETFRHKALAEAEGRMLEARPCCPCPPTHTSSNHTVHLDLRSRS